MASIVVSPPNPVNLGPLHIASKVFASAAVFTSVRGLMRRTSTLFGLAVKGILVEYYQFKLHFLWISCSS